MNPEIDAPFDDRPELSRVLNTFFANTPVDVYLPRTESEGDIEVGEVLEPVRAVVVDFQIRDNKLEMDVQVVDNHRNVPSRLTVRPYLSLDDAAKRALDTTPYAVPAASGYHYGDMNSLNPEVKL